MDNSNLTTIQFAQALFGLEPETPIAHEFDITFGQTDDRWWSCQREHFAMWAITQNTNGVKGYKHKPNTSAMMMYNRIGHYLEVIDILIVFTFMVMFTIQMSGSFVKRLQSRQRVDIRQTQNTLMLVVC